MPEKLKVLFLPHPVREDMFYPWGVDVVNAVRATGNDIEVCDYKAALAPQFAGVDVVIDVGGAAGTEEMAEMSAGQVRLWQILGTGLDHFEMDIWRSRGIPVANCPGQFSAVALAEHAMMMILLLAREYPRSPVQPALRHFLRAGRAGTGRQAPGAIRLRRQRHRTGETGARLRHAHVRHRHPPT